MNYFTKNSRTNKLKAKSYKLNRGMTYVELIVVLSIFAVITSTVLYNYQGFQAKVDIKNLASDVALKIVEAEKSSQSGILPPLSQQAGILPTWKPSYGAYFSTNPTSENKNIIYFVDLNSDGLYDVSSCPGSGECLDKISITKGNYISSLSVYYKGDTAAYPLDNLTISFTRPNSSAIIKSSSPFTPELVIDYVEISVVSTPSASGEVRAKIKVYPSGRLQID